MVNFPSRPNSRLFDPPVLAERGSVSRSQVIRPAGMAIVSRPQSGRWTLLRVADPRSASCAALHRLGGDRFFFPSRRLPGAWRGLPRHHGHKYWLGGYPQGPRQNPCNRA